MLLLLCPTVPDKIALLRLGRVCSAMLLCRALFMSLSGSLLHTCFALVHEIRLRLKTDLKLYLWHSQILPVQAYHACIIVVNPTTTLKASWQGAGSQLAQKLCAHLRPKCHPLLLDASINSPATVRLNLYQVRLLLPFLQTSVH